MDENQKVDEPPDNSQVNTYTLMPETQQQLKAEADYAFAMSQSLPYTAKARNTGLPNTPDNYDEHEIIIDNSRHKESCLLRPLPF